MIGAKALCRIRLAYVEILWKGTQGLGHASDESRERNSNARRLRLRGSTRSIQQRVERQVLQVQLVPRKALRQSVHQLSHVLGPHHKLAWKGALQADSNILGAGGLLAAV